MPPRVFHARASRSSLPQLVAAVFFLFVVTLLVINSSLDATSTANVAHLPPQPPRAQIWKVEPAAQTVAHARAAEPPAPVPVLPEPAKVDASLRGARAFAPASTIMAGART